MLRSFRWFRKWIGGVWVYRPHGGDWCRVTPLPEYQRNVKQYPRMFTVPGYSFPVPLAAYVAALGWEVENYSNTRLSLYPYRRS